MLKTLINKFNQGIQQHGLLYFIQLQATEQFYKYKFRKLSVEYIEGKSSLKAIETKSTNKDPKINSASPFYEIKKAFSFTGNKYSEISLLDIGCGDGKVLNFGMMLNFKEVVGIDLDQSAVDKTINNCRQMQKNGYSTKFNVMQTDASTFKVPEGINVIYLFNPFGKKTMKDVVNNILQHYLTYGRDLHIVYSIPVHQDLFLDQKEFVKIYERLNGSGTKSEMAIFRIRKDK